MCPFCTLGAVTFLVGGGVGGVVVEKLLTNRALTKNRLSSEKAEIIASGQAVSEKPAVTQPD